MNMSTVAQNRMEDNDSRKGMSKSRCPNCFQSLRWYMFFICVFFFFQGFIVNGYINVILVALETRFSLSSTLSGFLASCNDIGGILVILPVSYLGERRHKPRIIFGGILLMALGSLLFAVPHFAAGKYDYTSSANQVDGMENMCDVNSTAKDLHAPSSQSEASPLYTLFVIGQLLLGIGACPASTLGLSYIDENALPKMTSFYTGMLFSIAGVGVAVGFVAGGQILNIFVDVNTEDMSSIGLTPGDPQWVGAWWIGPLIALLAFLLIALPFLAFSKRLPGYDDVQRKRKSETHVDGMEDITVQPGFGENIRDFPRAVFLLLRCAPFMLVCLGAVADALLIGGISTFGAKIIQHRFNADISVAGLIMGMITVPGAGGGMLLGGYLVKRLNLKCRGILRLCTISALLSLLLAPILIASCPRAPLVGVSTYYRDSNEPGLESSCNVGCGCSTSGFEPVCVNSTTVFFSPCYAGCTEFSDINETKVYTNCSCVTETPGTEQQDALDPLGNLDKRSLITSSACADTCGWMYVYLVVAFVAVAFTFIALAPGVSAVLRCVPSKQRSLAIGLNLLFIRLLGTTPGPVLVGWILDSCCVVPQEMNGSATGLCWVYDIDQMGYRLLAWWIVLKLLSVIFYYLASRLYRKPQEVNSSSI